MCMMSCTREELLSIPKHLISNRKGTIQFMINVQSFLDCSGLSANCNCVNSTKPPSQYQLIVDVDFPQGTGPFPIVWLWHGKAASVHNCCRSCKHDRRNAL